MCVRHSFKPRVCFSTTQVWARKKFFPTKDSQKGRKHHFEIVFANTVKISLTLRSFDSCVSIMYSSILEELPDFVDPITQLYLNCLKLKCLGC